MTVFSLLHCSDLLASFCFSFRLKPLFVVPVIDVIVQDVLGGEEEAAVAALGPVALAGSKPLGVAVVSVSVE